MFYWHQLDCRANKIQSPINQRNIFKRVTVIIYLLNKISTIYNIKLFY